MSEPDPRGDASDRARPAASKSRSGGAKIGLALAIGAVLSGGAATNVLTRLFPWGVEGFRPGIDRWWFLDLAVGLTCVVIFAVCTWALYRLRNRIFAHHVRSDRNRVRSPRRVLITALSNDRDQNSGELRGDALLQALIADQRLGVDLFRLPKAEFDNRARELGVDITAWGGAPWLTNLVAVSVHSEALDAIVVVPSPSDGKGRGSDHRVETFRLIAEMLWMSSFGPTRRLEVRKTRPCDYDNYDELLEGIDEAIGLAGGASDRDLCIDVTSGTKPISIAGAVATMNTATTCIYVTNARHFVVFDARIGLGEGFLNE